MGLEPHHHGVHLVGKYPTRESSSSAQCLGSEVGSLKSSQKENSEKWERVRLERVLSYLLKLWAHGKDSINTC